MLAAASLESVLVHCNTFRFFMQKFWTGCINNSWLQCARGDTRALGNCAEGKIDVQESAMVKTRVPSVPACTSWYYEKHKNHYTKITLMLAKRYRYVPQDHSSQSQKETVMFGTRSKARKKHHDGLRPKPNDCCILMLVTKQKPHACCIVSGLSTASLKIESECEDLPILEPSSVFFCSNQRRLASWESNLPWSESALPGRTIQS